MKNFEFVLREFDSDDNDPSKKNVRFLEVTAQLFMIIKSRAVNLTFNKDLKLNFSSDRGTNQEI